MAVEFETMLNMPVFLGYILTAPVVRCKLILLSWRMQPTSIELTLIFDEPFLTRHSLQVEVSSNCVAADQLRPERDVL